MALKDNILNTNNINKIFSILQNECVKRFASDIDPQKYLPIIYNTAFNMINEDPKFDEIKPIKKNLDTFNKEIIIKILRSLKNEVQTEIERPRISESQSHEYQTNIEDAMMNEINKRNTENGMRIPFPEMIQRSQLQSPSQSQPPLTKPIETSSGSGQHQTTSTYSGVTPYGGTITSDVNNFSPFENTSLEYKYITLDFRADLIDIDENIYTLRFPTNVKANMFELYSCQMQSTGYIKNEPSLLVNISGFDGNYICGNEKKFFCKLVPQSIVDEIFLFRPEQHLYELNSKQKIEDTITISFNRYDGTPFSLTKLLIEKITNTNVKTNKIEEIKTKITTTHKHGLDKTDTVSIIYNKYDELKVICCDIFHIIDDYNFIIMDKLEYTKDDTIVHKKSLKCNLTFRLK